MRQYQADLDAAPGSRQRHLLPTTWSTRTTTWGPGFARPPRDNDWHYLAQIGDRYSDPPKREYLDEHLLGGVYRCYRVLATNGIGDGAWSRVVKMDAGAVPPEYLYVWGEADGQNAITLYWDEPFFDGGAPVTSYQLQYAADQRNDAEELVWRSLTSPGASVRHYTHTGPKVGETWHYRIRARNSAGWSEWSDSIDLTIVADTTANIAQPTLTARATTSTEVLLSWSKLCDPNRDGDCEGKGIDGYTIFYSEDGGAYGWERLSWFWTDQTSFLHQDLKPGTTYYYRVAGHDEVNGRHLYGRRSQVKSATTGDFHVGAPQNFTVTAEAERELKLEWDAPTTGEDLGSITGYRIERSANPGDDSLWRAIQTNRTQTVYVDRGLTPDTFYYYRVAAVTRNGSVPYIGPYAWESEFTLRPGG